MGLLSTSLIFGEGKSLGNNLENQLVEKDTIKKDRPIVLKIISEDGKDYLDRDGVFRRSSNRIYELRDFMQDIDRDGILESYVVAYDFNENYVADAFGYFEILSQDERKTHVSNNAFFVIFDLNEKRSGFKVIGDSNLDGIMDSEIPYTFLEKEVGNDFLKEAYE